MTWREEVEQILRDAGKTLRCGPLPSTIRMAVPTPVGRTVQVCPAKLAPNALVRLHKVLVVIAKADLTARQRDLLWGRAFELSWKQIGKAYPRASDKTLRRDYDSAVDEIWNQLYGPTGKSVTNRESYSVSP